MCPPGFTLETKTELRSDKLYFQLTQKRENNIGELAQLTSFGLVRPDGRVVGDGGRLVRLLKLAVRLLVHGRLQGRRVGGAQALRPGEHFLGVPLQVALCVLVHEVCHHFPPVQPDKLVTQMLNGQSSNS